MLLLKAQLKNSRNKSTLKAKISRRFGTSSTLYRLVKSNNVSVDGAWAAWTDWTSCSTSCGKGSVTRSRSCSNPSAMNGGKNCSGNATEVKDCILRDCPGM